jgi:hypothetical protein
LSVHSDDADRLTVTWSGAVSVDPGPLPDSSFTVDGVQPESIQAIDGTHTRVTITGGSSPGLQWDLTAQPNWLTTTSVTPETGTTT